MSKLEIESIEECSKFLEGETFIYNDTECVVLSDAEECYVLGYKKAIEKACENFCKIICNGHPPRSTCISLGTCREYDDFRKAMED